MEIRNTTPADGAKLWQLVRESEALELNSAYFYVLMATHFADSCVIAEDEDGRAAGFVVGHRPPRKPDTVFVWQVGVADWPPGSVGSSTAWSRASPTTASATSRPR